MELFWMTLWVRFLLLVEDRISKIDKWVEARLQGVLNTLNEITGPDRD